MGKSIIWNLTRACCWSCNFCCVSAINYGMEQINLAKDKSFKIINELTYNQKNKLLINYQEKMYE